MIPALPMLKTLRRKALARFLLPDPVADARHSAGADGSAALGGHPA